MWYPPGCHSSRETGFVSRLLCRLQQQQFQLRNALLADARFARHIGQLFTVVKGEHIQLRPLLLTRGNAMQMIEARVQIRAFHRVIAAEIVQLLFRWHRRCTAVTGYHQRATGVGVAARLFPALIVEPAAQQARHKRIAGAQHVEHLNAHAAVQARLFPAVRNLALKHHTTQRPAFADQRGAAGLTHIFSAVSVSVLPPAIWNSSSVPTIRSK